MNRRYWYHRSTKTWETYPPPSSRKIYGQAPQVIAPSMPKTYHEGVGRFIEDRKEWEIADKQTGCITFSGIDEVRRHAEKGKAEEAKALKADRRKAGETALAAYRANPKDVRQRLEKQGEKQIETLKKSRLLNKVKEQLKNG